VIGCGTVGLGAIAAAAHRGATVIALDMDEGKLAVAKRAGAAHTIRGQQHEDAAGSTVREQILALTSGDGPGVVIEAVGTPETFRLAVEVAAFAGRVVYIGFAKEPVSYETRWFVLKELDILGSRNATPEDFETVIAMLERARISRRRDNRLRRATRKSRRSLARVVRKSLQLPQNSGRSRPRSALSAHTPTL
jgi:threonine dehydrogenase-like Zn-dependent dehydrogenase